MNAKVRAPKAPSGNVQLSNLSPKAAEIRREYMMRQNPVTPAHISPRTLGDKNPKGYVTGGKTVNPKLPGQAMPVNRVAITPKGDYVPGDGDFPTALRPGCDDHKKYKSLSTAGTVTYARSHV